MYLQCWVMVGRCSGSFRSPIPLSFSVKSGTKSLTVSECGRRPMEVSEERKYELSCREWGMYVWTRECNMVARKLQGGP